MPKVTKILGNNKARACESLGFAHKKRLSQHFDTTSCFFCYIDKGSMEQSRPAWSDAMRLIGFRVSSSILLTENLYVP